MNMKHIVLTAALLLGALTPALVWQTPAQAEGEAKERTPAQNFTLKNLSGKKVSLSDYKGKVVVVTFWATWCKPCLQELPYLWGFQKRYKDDGFVVLAISTDDSGTLSKVRSTATKWKADYSKYKDHVLLDQDSDVIAALNPRGNQPFTLMIDRQGRVVEQHEGFDKANVPKYEDSIKALLAEKP